MAEDPLAEEQQQLDRRSFLKLLAALPVLGGLVAIGSPLLRYLKPNLPPGRPLPAVTDRDLPAGEPVIAARLGELRGPWSFKYFVFVQQYPQYTQEGAIAANIPGVVIRLPWTVRFPQGEGKTIETDLVAFSRICPHLGCIFNYEPNYRNVTAGYGGYTPPPFRQHALLACPCHLSIYDPADRQVPGRVISGPAPRPPRYFTYQVRGEDVVITGAEHGGIA